MDKRTAALMGFLDNAHSVFHAIAALETELRSAGYQLGDITETKLLSPAAMDKSIGKKKVEELLTDMIDRTPGAPTIAKESDKRKPYDRLAEAQKDFE